jgi:hypothetical protein
VGIELFGSLADVNGLRRATVPGDRSHPYLRFNQVVEPLTLVFPPQYSAAATSYKLGTPVGSTKQIAESLCVGRLELIPPPTPGFSPGLPTVGEHSSHQRRQGSKDGATKANERCGHLPLLLVRAGHSTHADSAI